MKQVFKNKKSLLIFFALFIIFSFLFVSGAKGLETDWPTAPGGKTLDDDSTLVDFVEYSYRWAILLGGLAAFFALVFAGFKYLTSVGDPSKMKDARERITAAILGLILLLSTFLILNTLNPELTTLHAPTTTVGGFSPGTFGSGPSDEPCHEVKFYKEKNFGKPIIAAYSENICIWWYEFIPPPPECAGIPFQYEDCVISRCDPSDQTGLKNHLGLPGALRLQLDQCTQIGGQGWPIVGWFGQDIPMDSVKIDGGCLVKIFEYDNCTGNSDSISMTDPNIGVYGQENQHGLKLIDRSPPEIPVVKVCNPNLGVCPAYNETMDSSGTSSQVNLTGILERNPQPNYLAAFTSVYILYGTDKEKLSKTFPDKDGNFPYPDLAFPYFPEVYPAPPPWTIPWGTVPIMIEEVPPLPGGEQFTYTVTGLATGTMYYWKVKAITDVGKHDISDNFATFTTPNI